MIELQEAIKVVNEIIETCRMTNYCDMCPYWNDEKGECSMQMESLANCSPYEW